MSPLTREQKEFQTALTEGKNETVVQVVKTGLDPNFEFPFGLHSTYPEWTPLMWAAYFDEITLETMQVLIANGADVNATNYLGRTAMHQASSREKFFALMEAGANPHMINKGGDSPVDKKEKQGLLWTGIRAEVEWRQARKAKKPNRGKKTEEPYSEIDEMRQRMVDLEERQSMMNQEAGKMRLIMEAQAREMQRMKAELKPCVDGLPPVCSLFLNGNWPVEELNSRLERHKQKSA